MNRSLNIIGTITYTILAILALVFYLERTAFVDISFHLFYILKDGTFAIQNNRFGAFMTQIIPLIGSKLGLSLNAIMKFYSVGFVLFYSGIFFIITTLLKAPKFGLAMLLLSTLMVTDTFYWIQSELPQGLAFMVLYFSILYTVGNHKKYKNWVTHPLIAVMTMMLVFFHPLLVFPFLFCSIFFYLNDNASKDYLKGGLLLYCILLLIKTLFFKTNYDSAAITGASNITNLFPNYIFLHSNKQFLLDIVSKYLLLILMLLGMTYFYIRGRQFLKASLMVSFFIGYLFLVNVSYPDGAASFYMENLYLPLSVYVIVPFAFDFKIKNQVQYNILLILILVISIARIGIHHHPYSDRINLLKHYLHDTEGLTQKKLIISDAKFPMDSLMMSWATPYENWLLSTISDHETRSVMITDNVDEVAWTMEYNNKFVTKWGSFDYSELPQKYFILKDTTRYSIVE